MFYGIAFNVTETYIFETCIIVLADIVKLVNKKMVLLGQKVFLFTYTGSI